MATTKAGWVGLTVALAMGQASARAYDVAGRGRGSGGDSTTPPVTKSSGTAFESSSLAAHDLPFEPRKGLMGAPGAAPDQAGPARLGGHGERSARPSFGEAATQGGGGASGSWRSGDRVRSLSSADVRAARGQQAPDLEWAPAAGGRPQDPRQEPQEPYGIRFSVEQQKPLR